MQLMVSNDTVTKCRGDKQRVAAYKYQRNSRYFAQIAEGLIEAGAEELAELGAEDIALEFLGIHFRADKSILYRINYLTRLASRCLAPLCLGVKA
jgi:putative N6-adenine-specific DNA methylase